MSQQPNHNNSTKTVLITVGTTEFQDLVKIIDSEPFTNLLRKHGFQNIVYQTGRGIYTPQLSSKHFQLDPDISKRYVEADLIICHGGAGTLLQCLLMGKKIIAVVNDTLAGNHQYQIVNQLANQSYVLGFSSALELKNNGIHKIDQFLTRQNLQKDFREKGSTEKTEAILNKLVFGQ